MALEPAGIDLQAKGFTDYIKKLDAIEKKQRKAFEAEFKGTKKSYAEVTRAAKDYEKQLNDTVEAERKAAREAEKLAQAQVKAANKARKAQQKQAQAQVAQQKQAKQARRGAVGQVVGGVAGAALAGGPLGLITAGALAFNEFRKEAIELSRTQAAAEAQLSAALRSTGGAAGLTANQLKAHASALQDVTNFGDEVTIAAQAQLLTFTKIGSTVFPQATKAVLDLATRMDGDLKGATIQIGKALNDPIAGLSSLTRSGIQFTDQQKEQIRTLTESGNVVGAQTIILKELETQFGGSAEAARAADGGNIALSNSFGDLQEELGEISIAFGKTFNTAETGIKIIGFLQDRIETLQQIVAFAGAGITAFGSVISQTFGRIVTTVKNIGSVIKGEATEPIKTFSQILDEAGDKAIVKFKDLATVFGATFDDQESLEKVDDNIDEATKSVDAYSNSLKRAEQLQLSFTRAAEDTARKLARANEDIARKQVKSVDKLQENQKKDRDDLLADQIEQLDNFDKNRQKQIKDAEDEIRKTRNDAGEQQKRDQQKLQRELQRAKERFDLSRLQSTRRFDLQESRLRAEGDILGLKELREDFALQQTEEKENFDFSKKEQIGSAKQQQKEQSKDLGKRLGELKGNLEDQRADLLASFDEQLKNQQIAQIERKAEQQRGFEEAAAERIIQLAREEEDRRISQARQLEDLGRSLAEQKGVTEEGSAAIAAELEKVFGIEGVADNIMTGFAAKTESDFTTLFKNLESIVSSADLEPKITPELASASLVSGGSFGGRQRLGGVQEFNDGGIVQGPLGSPQAVIAHAGETVIPTHKSSFQMAAPVIPAQNLDISMSGGFNITGGEQAGEAAVQAAVSEMTENFKIAVRRLARRN